MALVNFGNQVLGSTTIQFPPANNKAVCRFQNNTGFAVPVAKFHGKWTGAYLSAKTRAVIYSDNAGNPDALLATSNEKVGITSSWNAFTFPSPVTVAAGAYVWIGVISDTLMTESQCLTTGTIKYNADTYSDGAASTFGSPSSTTATYPMYVEGDDGQLRFGRASVDTASGNYQINREHGERFVLGGVASVSVASISTYVRTTSATVKSKAAIFTDSAGLPGTKVAQTVEVAGSSADAWLVLNFSSPVTLAPGTYWLAFICDENLVTPTIPSGGTLRADGADTEATAFSSPSSLAGVGSMDVAPIGIDIYASYSAVPPSAGRPCVFVCM